MPGKLQCKRSLFVLLQMYVPWLDMIGLVFLQPKVPPTFTWGQIIFPKPIACFPKIKLKRSVLSYPQMIFVSGEWHVCEMKQQASALLNSICWSRDCCFHPWSAFLGRVYFVLLIFTCYILQGFRGCCLRTWWLWLWWLPSACRVSQKWKGRWWRRRQRWWRQWWNGAPKVQVWAPLQALRIQSSCDRWVMIFYLCVWYMLKIAWVLRSLYLVRSTSKWKLAGPEGSHARGRWCMLRWCVPWWHWSCGVRTQRRHVLRRP